MPRLRDRISIERSAEQTQDGLEQLLRSLRGKDGASRVRLRVPINGRTIAPNLSIGREVSIEVRNGLAISWAPEGTLVFPSFEGTLAVRGDSNRSYIELDGSYTEPFGAAGQRFDATVGHEIAQATAREFLGDLRRAIEGAQPTT